MKKFLVSLFVIIFGLIVLMPVPTASAASVTSNECNDRAQFAVNAFLGFPTWYRGLELEANAERTGCILAEKAFEGKEIGLIIFTIALNVIDIALRIAGLIAVGFVIWGGFHYTMSRGDPESTKKSLNIIRSAIIGVGISMVSSAVFSFLVWRLGQ
ncbi:pilin [Candidatus Saccharibacteria bacterium]|nr:pilin [Candidatus Saccharibacteria bacterium]